MNRPHKFCNLIAFIFLYICVLNAQNKNVDKNFSIGLGLNYSDYSPGIEKGLSKGYAYSSHLSLQYMNSYMDGVKITLGRYFIKQRSERICEPGVIIGDKFSRQITYFDFLARYSSTYFTISFGFSLNNSGETNTVCSNDIYFESPLLSYDVGAGLIRKFYVNFGFNTDYQINPNLGVFNTGINFYFMDDNYSRINYYWREDYFGYKSGWIIQTNFRLTKTFNIEPKIYYLKHIDSLSYNLILYYIL